MNFLYPAFLIAALAVAIPILIHLFNFRKFKKILFPDIRFLTEVKDETNKRSKLKHLLMLATRVLAVLSLVLAFAQPFFGEKNKDQNKAKCISLYIDNSYSMLIQKNGVPLLELAKSKAKELVQNSSNADVFLIVTNSFKNSDNKPMNKQQALAVINAIQITPEHKNMNAVVQKQLAGLQSSDAPVKQLLYISDFQIQQHQFPISITDNTRKFLLPIQSNGSPNVCIDTAYFDVPTISAEGGNELCVRMKNTDEKNSINTTIHIQANEQVKTVKAVSLQPNESKLERIPYSVSQPGWQRIQLYITDYPVSFDDTFYLAGNVSNNKSVLLVNEGANNPYLNAVFKTSTAFRCDNAQPATVSTAAMGKYSLVVLNNLSNIDSALATKISSYVDNGGSVLLFPSSKIQLASYNASLAAITGCVWEGMDTSKQTVTSVQKENALIKNIFEKIPDNVALPIAYKHYPLRSSTFSSEQKIFSFANGDAFLSCFTKNNGKLYVCTSPADNASSSFMNSYWFLPLLYNMAFIGNNDPVHAYTLGQPSSMKIYGAGASDNNMFRISSKAYEAIPEQRQINGATEINFAQATQQAGMYSVYLPNANNNNTYYAGLNYNRAESDMKYWSTSDIKSNNGLSNAAILDNTMHTGVAMGQQAEGNNWWQICLIAALTFLLIEVLLARFFR